MKKRETYKTRDGGILIHLTGSVKSAIKKKADADKRPLKIYIELILENHAKS